MLAVEPSAAGVVLLDVCLLLLEGEEGPQAHIRPACNSTTPKVLAIVALVGGGTTWLHALLTGFSPSDVSPAGAAGSGRSGFRSSV